MHTVQKNTSWEDNIKINFKETGWGSVDWIHLTHDMTNGCCEHRNGRSCFVKCGECLDWLVTC